MRYITNRKTNQKRTIVAMICSMVVKILIPSSDYILLWFESNIPIYDPNSFKDHVGLVVGYRCNFKNYTNLVSKYMLLRFVLVKFVMYNLTCEYRIRLQSYSKFKVKVYIAKISTQEIFVMYVCMYVRFVLRDIYMYSSTTLMCEVVLPVLPSLLFAFMARV